jgi:hypothetical protein
MSEVVNFILKSIHFEFVISATIVPTKIVQRLADNKNCSHTKRSSIPRSVLNTASDILLFFCFAGIMLNKLILAGLIWGGFSGRL